MCISNLFPLSFLFFFSFFGTKPFCAPHQRNSFHVHLVSPFNKDKVLKIKKRVLNLSQTKKFKGRGGKMKGGLSTITWSKGTGCRQRRAAQKTDIGRRRLTSKKLGTGGKGVGKGNTYLSFIFLLPTNGDDFFLSVSEIEKNYPTEFNFYNIKEHLCLTCGYSEKNNCFKRRKTSVELENNCFYTLKTERLFHI